MISVLGSWVAAISLEISDSGTKVSVSGGGGGASEVGSAVAAGAVGGRGRGGGCGGLMNWCWFTASCTSCFSSSRALFSESGRSATRLLSSLKETSDSVTLWGSIEFGFSDSITCTGGSGFRGSGGGGDSGVSFSVTVASTSSAVSAILERNEQQSVESLARW